MLFDALPNALMSHWLLNDLEWACALPNPYPGRRVGKPSSLRVSEHLLSGMKAMKQTKARIVETDARNLGFMRVKA